MRLFLLFISMIIFNQLSTQNIIAENIFQPQKPRIVGGIDSVEGEWPWIAALVDNYDEAQCGASLIHPRWLITAAHCIENKSGGWKSTGSFKIVVGLYDLTKDQEPYRYEIDRFIPHPDYDTYKVDSDIALIELKKEVPFTYTPIELYKKEITNQTGTVLGWGNTVNYNPDDPDNPSYYPIYSDQLKEVLLPIIGMDLCRSSTEYSITDNMFCAGYQDGKKDACDGDSGGPFILLDDNKWKLAGIVSWGEGCAWPGYYGVYTRIPNFISFIESYVPLPVQGDIDKNGKVELKDLLIIFENISKTLPKNITEIK